jgi:hypothetical protein
MELGFVPVFIELRKPLAKDTVIDTPKGIPHLLGNTGESTFRFLVVKLPKTA